MGLVSRRSVCNPTPPKRLIRQETEARLRFEPEAETRNRKPLKWAVAFEAEWDLRFGPNNRFRVSYQVDRAPGDAVAHRRLWPLSPGCTRELDLVQTGAKAGEGNRVPDVLRFLDREGLIATPGRCSMALQPDLARLLWREAAPMEPETDPKSRWGSSPFLNYDIDY